MGDKTELVVGDSTVKDTNNLADFQALTQSLGFTPAQSDVMLDQYAAIVGKEVPEGLKFKPVGRPEA
jgi:hypothetical protein